MKNVLFYFLCRYYKLRRYLFIVLTTIIAGIIDMYIKTTFNKLISLVMYQNQDF